ncbi:hypothetical protein [Paenibacillus endoradicis]|uniref:hypothetical protein n=1 Tax=Paenibacillus endoradicis TaxID=2972487 RepID=UPI0021590EEB|nr:hypothetical protein [Paenibacillus endoradicis]MCR8656123.1 hypothetical protein [Paenibacillus endoradicis]MCR8658449.1 hypothetical protein [Paenibacillus endoradicis]
MKFNIKTFVWVILYAMMAGGTLSLFTTISSFIKYLFSLLAVYIGVRFFRRFETIGLRITFIVLAIIMFFIGVFITVVYQSLTNPDFLLGQ